MGSQEETRELLARARQGDRQAFDRLVEAQRDRLLAFIRKRLGNHLRGEADPEDILQETYLKAIGRLDRFEWRGEGSFFGWLAATAEYVIRALGRSFKGSHFELDREPAAPTPSPSRALRREERFDRLEAALQALSEDHREVLLSLPAPGGRSRESSGASARRVGAGSPRPEGNVGLRAGSR